MQTNTPLTTDLLNNTTISLLNLSSHTSIQHSFQTSNRSNSTIRPHNKENISPIKKPTPYQAPWFLKKAPSNLRRDPNYKNQEKSLYKCETEGEKLLYTWKRLMVDYNKGLGELQGQKDSMARKKEYLERRKKGILKELTHCNNLQREILSKIRGNCNNQGEILIKSEEKPQQNINLSSSESLYPAYQSLSSELNAIITKIDTSECLYQSLSEQCLMLQEDLTSHQVQKAEIASEYEEIDSVLDSFKASYPKEYITVVFQRDFLRKQNNIKESIIQRKNDINRLETEMKCDQKEQKALERVIEGLEERLQAFRDKKRIEKKKKLELQSLCYNLSKGLDPISVEAFNRYCEAFFIEEGSFELQQGILKELIQWSQRDYSLNLSLDSKIEGNMSVSNGNSLKILQKLSIMNKQVYLTVISGFIEDKEAGEFLKELIPLLIKARNHVISFHTCEKDLQNTLNEYTKASNRLLDVQEALNTHTKELSKELKALSCLKTELKGLEGENARIIKDSEGVIIRNSDEMMKEFLIDQKEELKELGFKFGKGFLQKYKDSINLQLKTAQNTEYLKIQGVICQALTRRDFILKEKPLLRDFQQEYSDIQQEKLEIKAIIRVWRQKAAGILCKLIEISGDIQNLDSQRISLYKSLERICPDSLEGLELLKIRVSTLEKELKDLEEGLEGINKGLDIALIKELDEKKGRIEVLEEYMKKKGISNEIMKESPLLIKDNDEMMKGFYINKGTKNKEENIKEYKGVIKRNISSLSFDSNINGNILKECNNPKDNENFIKKKGYLGRQSINSSFLNEKNMKETIDSSFRRHIPSKSFVDKLPAKFGLVTIDLNELKDITKKKEVILTRKPIIVNKNKEKINLKQKEIGIKSCSFIKKK